MRAGRWNCRPTEYQAALLLHRLKAFKECQATRLKNFQLLRALMKEITCLAALSVHPGVRAHGMYMFAMRYKSTQCGGISVDQFIELVQAEGAPIHRAFTTTMSGQPALQHLMQKRPEYFRLLPTPIADRAAEEMVYIAHDVFLGAAGDMEDIAAAIRKVEEHCAGMKARKNRKVA